MKRLFIFIMGVMMAVVATSRTFDMKQLGADAKGIKPCTKLINQTIEKAASEGGRYQSEFLPECTYLRLFYQCWRRLYYHQVRT